MRSGSRRTSLVFALAVVVCACGGRTSGVARLAPAIDYLDADVPELIARANAWTAASLRGRGQLRMYWSGDQDSRHVDVQMFATATGALNLRGSRSLAGVIFQLIADGREFQLAVPDHSSHYRGTSAALAQPDPERPYFALRPQHMTTALLPEPLPTSNTPASGIVPQTYPDHYALTWTQTEAGVPRIRRRVSIGRADLRVSRIEGFDEDGRIEFVADYSNYIGSGMDAYPGSVRVERVWEELVFRFDLSEVQRHPTIPEVAFRFPALPRGYRALTIEEAMAEFRREGGG